jgi:hypothetical protein
VVGKMIRVDFGMSGTRVEVRCFLCASTTSLQLQKNGGFRCRGECRRGSAPVGADEYSLDLIQP